MSEADGNDQNLRLSALLSPENRHRAGWAVLTGACSLFGNQPNLALVLLMVGLITIAITSLLKQGAALADKADSLESMLLSLEVVEGPRRGSSRLQRRNR